MNETLMLVFNGISALCFFLGVFTLNGFRTSMSDMQKSIGELNVNIAKLLVQDLNKDQRLDDQSELIAKLDKEVQKLRDRYHDMVNKSTSKLDMMAVELEELKRRLNKQG